MAEEFGTNDSFDMAADDIVDLVLNAGRCEFTVSVELPPIPLLASVSTVQRGNHHFLFVCDRSEEAISMIEIR